MSQIIYLGLCIDFMKSRKISMKKNVLISKLKCIDFLATLVVSGILFSWQMT